jgi:hypothetical protein
MAYLSTVYCTPEDILIRSPGDFAVLVPDGQTLADGADGAFDPADRWTLTSAAVDFAAAGVAPGDVCLITYDANKKIYGPEGDILAVESAVGGSLTLRRRGRPAGVGQPPGPAVGLAGVSFWVPDLQGQIEEASWDVDDRYGVDEAVPDSAPDMLYRLRELRQVTVLSALALLYAGRSRGVDDAFDKKTTSVKAELDDLLARVQVRWRSSSQPDVSNRFGRIVRG